MVWRKPCLERAYTAVKPIIVNGVEILKLLWLHCRSVLVRKRPRIAGDTAAIVHRTVSRYPIEAANFDGAEVFRVSRRAADVSLVVSKARDHLNITMLLSSPSPQHSTSAHLENIPPHSSKPTSSFRNPGTERASLAKSIKSISRHHVLSRCQMTYLILRPCRVNLLLWCGIS